MMSHLPSKPIAACRGRRPVALAVAVLLLRTGGSAARAETKLSCDLEAAGRQQ
jgi:hypothetical protein